MAVEKRRGCGYRKISGLYLVGSPGAFFCDRLPIKVTSCPTCGGGIHPSLGFTWINANELLDGPHLIEQMFDSSKPWKPGDPPLQRFLPCEDGDAICREPPTKCGLMWVGSKFYTPESFMAEAREMGVCKRIAAIPRDFKIGETWILLGHRGGYYEALEKRHYPGIFYAFVPIRIEKLVPDDTPEEEMKKLRENGVVPIVVPKDDKDHQGSVYDDVKSPSKRRRLVEREGRSLLESFFDESPEE